MSRSGKNVLITKGPPRLLKSTKVTKDIASNPESQTPKLVIRKPKESTFRSLIPKNIKNEDIDKILRLKYFNKDRYIINSEDKYITIEVIGMLHNYDFDYILDFLTDAPDQDWILWDNKYMNIGKISVEREILINRVEEVGVKGVGKCRFCSKDELVYNQKQVNSGDEPMKVYVRCVSCNKHWIQ